MARPARIRIAGTIAATALCVAAATSVATPASAQSQDGTIVLNNQLQLGDVIAGQTLNVVDASDQVTVSTSAQGNTFTGAVQNDSITLDSTQRMEGDARATTTMTFGGDTDAVVNATTQAGGNYLAVSAYDSDLSVDADQVVTDGEISASSTITGNDARLLQGGTVSVSAISNTVAAYGEGATVVGTISQASSATVRAANLAAAQYIPAEADFSTQALANAVTSTSDLASNQTQTLVQRSTGDLIEAGTAVSVGNAWDLAGRANAGANQAIYTNQGGSLVTTTDQSNSARVTADASVSAFDYGAATAYARGAANEVVVGNNDIYVEIDNTQFNSGGVDVSASFSGAVGYDAYVGADAVGNSVTGYACSTCEGYLDADNTQTNAGDVRATAQTTVSTSGRSVITGANAVGNAATFYVSRPAQ